MTRNLQHSQWILNVPLPGALGGPRPGGPLPLGPRPGAPLGGPLPGAPRGGGPLGGPRPGAPLGGPLPPLAPLPGGPEKATTTGAL